MGLPNVTTATNQSRIPVRPPPRSVQTKRSRTARGWTAVVSILLAAYFLATFSLIRFHKKSSSEQEGPRETPSLGYSYSSNVEHHSIGDTISVRPVKVSGQQPSDHKREHVLPEATTDSRQQPSSDECPVIERKYRHPPSLIVDRNNFDFDKSRAEAYLRQHGPSSIRHSIQAYIEGPLNDTVPGTGSRGNLDNPNDEGVPPDFIIPLPLRKQRPEDLRRYEYPRVQTCHDMPGKFPIDKGLEIDPETGEPIVWNVGNQPMPPDFPDLEAPHCPVEADPFLPWIHDMFPAQDGSRIEFVAQNKRRCRTGTKFTPEINRLVPQVALMQAVSVQKLSEQEAREMAPDLWHPADDTATPRYRLAPLDEVTDPDAMYTRFICRFHAVQFPKESDDDSGGDTVDTATNSLSTKVVGETLSQYPFNYEMVSYRKGVASTTLISPGGKDTRLFWASNIRFNCPVPESLQTQVANGDFVLQDGTPTLYVDLIPIRTSVRYKELHMTSDLIGPEDHWQLPKFNALERWGNRNVLPRVEASGRWSHLPVCAPPKFKDTECSANSTKDEEDGVLIPAITNRPKKPHVLSACVWASAEFKTRGLIKGATTDTATRLQEWIEFHLMVGFDHIYLYDNSGAHTNAISLADIVDQYPGKITRIDWPSIVCNNNIPAHDSTGERSSQYAAENSCRTRYAPYTEWIAAFDTDEYFVPMGNYTSLKDVLRDAEAKGTNILSLRSSRGRLRIDKSDQIGKTGNAAREKFANVTFLEAYNCDSAGSPKPSWADRARKQIYRTDYVLYHYVHYSTVTRGYLQTYGEMMKKNQSWKRHFGERAPSERVTDELHEAVLLHSKTLAKDMTAKYETRCKHDYEKKWQGCWVAFPFPPNHSPSDGNADKNGNEYNCYINERVDNFWVPRLREALRKRREGWAGVQSTDRSR